MNLLTRTRNAPRRSGRYTAPVLIKRPFSFRKNRADGGSSNDDESSLDSGFTRQLEADIFQMATTDRQRGDKQRGRANDDIESSSVATASLGEFTDATEDIIQEHSPEGCGWDIRAVNLYITRAIFPVSVYRDDRSSVLDNTTLESNDDSFTCGTSGCNPFDGGRSEMHEV